MTTKKNPEAVSEENSATPAQVESIIGLSYNRRQSLIDAFVSSVLTGVKFDLERGMPDRDKRKKIINFATKLADEVIASS